ncbi:class I SAM-dependent methyltransferase [Mucilaginibacter lappiensis]|uniref:Ubiquinone/menaquinone biosynthesis C-methylase UbiE n=1 Tax=Mucilaginibacter lappiensis TaxID=354630 RepID=A0A1N7GBH8_9SPHI|nr:class I SAM-dependent methyltransferase [Mucilaginibacter lappiensis]MBB6112959.1 ubiquinone/menaquinone biosynthesis C-methylase UbiE [Mucilaginibacter lappiensis]MBB6131679.1 ubiquinone/menaquinone biosynthesis C-methylase UbiE [Mucilaginibacter lappiensis]SIS09943.1 Ubiquinone/menaquinone biosynthesis C-methylase UbiE [Mucilaginibacter lappiensis]
MAANFNNSAWFYDRLSRLVYGRALVNAQLYLLGFIKPNSNILIVGGGTGWILEELTKLYPLGLHITYVEVAAGMMELSKKRNTGGNKIAYIQNAIEQVNLNPGFDVVITPFLFDNFTEQTLKTVFNHIHNLLKPQSLWLNADFQLTGKWWQLFLLKSMFVFFRLICGIEAGKLPEIKTHFTANSYAVVDEKTFFNDFIVANVYRKKMVYI